jgi:hypothetical protein
MAALMETVEGDDDKEVVAKAVDAIVLVATKIGAEGVGARF